MLIFTIFIVSLIIRLSLISKGPFHLDCLHMVLKAQASVDTGNLFYLHGLGHPLVAMISSSFVWLMRVIGKPDPVFAVNLMSVIFSSLSVAMLYVMALQFFDRRSALLSAILFSFSPIFLGVSVWGNSHSIYLFFLFCSIHQLFRYFQTQYHHTLMSAAILFGLSGAARIQDTALIALPVSMLFWLGHLQKTTAYDTEATLKRLKDLGSFAIIAAIPIILLHIPSLEDYKLTQLPHLLVKDLTIYWKGKIIIYMKKAMEFLIIDLSIPGIIASIGSVWYLRKNKKLLIFLLSWFIISFIINANFANIIPRYLCVAIVPLYLAQGYLISHLSKESKFFKITAAVLLIAIFALNTSRIFPILLFRHQYDYLADYARWVGKNTSPDARIIVADDWLFINYYSRRNTINRPRTIAHSIDQGELAKFKKKLDTALQNGHQVFITHKGLFSYDYEREFSQYIRDNYNLYYVGERFTEDWHKGVLYVNLHIDKMYKIKLKNK